jgi:serine/threonine protein kinase
LNACSGYISPEYAIEGLYSVKSDVFSFGVLVLEIVSGYKNRGFSHPEHNLYKGNPHRFNK